MTYVTVRISALSEKTDTGQIESYEDNFLVDTGATDTIALSGKLREAGIKPVGKMVFELADGRLEEYQYGLARIKFNGGNHSREGSVWTAWVRAVVWSDGSRVRGNFGRPC